MILALFQVLKIQKLYLLIRYTQKYKFSQNQIITL